MILRHGDRLWKLRVLEAEIRLIVRFRGKERPVRFYVSNESGYYLDIQVYRETRGKENRAGHAKLIHRKWSDDTPSPLDVSIFGTANRLLIFPCRASLSRILTQ